MVGIWESIGGRTPASFMRYLLAILCALAIAAAQSLYGGVMRPVFALPAYLAVLGVAGILALSALFWRNIPFPALACVASVAAFAGWLFWREMESPDPWLASGYVRLTLACLVIYLLFACIITNPLHRLAFISLLLLLRDDSGRLSEPGSLSIGTTPAPALDVRISQGFLLQSTSMAGPMDFISTPIIWPGSSTSPGFLRWPSPSGEGGASKRRSWFFMWAS